MRGRPLTGEEYERMCAAAGKMLPRPEGMQKLLEGLWLSGLRLSEALELSWNNPAALMVWEIDSRRPLLSIPEGADKSRQERLLPLTPDFVAFLRSLPERKGRVFRPLTAKGNPLRSKDNAGKLISSIGKASKVVVERTAGVKGSPTAQDLRRSFGYRWSRLVMPAVLKELMRHGDISTTLTYYVGQSAARTAEEVWDAGQRDTLRDTSRSGSF